MYRPGASVESVRPPPNERVLQLIGTVAMGQDRPHLAGLWNDRIGPRVASLRVSGGWLVSGGERPAKAGL